jgi:hypothetical protein
MYLFIENIKNSWKIEIAVEILYVMTIYKGLTGSILTEYNEKQLFNRVKRVLSMLPFIMNMNI